MEGPFEGNERQNRLEKVYLAIISRYKDYIEEKESLSVAELPVLVTPINQKVNEKADEIKSEFLNYDYDSNFLEASQKAYEFVKNVIDNVVLPLQFWLTPEETLVFMLGDSMDKNILLCSMLVSLGNPSSKVLVKLVDSTRKTMVYYEFKGILYMLDLETGISNFSSKDELLKSLGMNDEAVAYEFNNQMYADLY